MSAVSTHRVFLLYLEILLAAAILLLGSALPSAMIGPSMPMLQQGNTLPMQAPLGDPPADTSCPIDDLRRSSCEARYMSVI
jgi:hypothetical protein